MPKALTPYTAFIQKHYHTKAILALPVRDRFKELGRRWQAEKANKKPPAKAAASKPTKAKRKPRGSAKRVAKKAKTQQPRNPQTGEYETK